MVDKVTSSAGHDGRRESAQMSAKFPKQTFGDPDRKPPSERQLSISSRLTSVLYVACAVSLTISGTGFGGPPTPSHRL
jgi:hypothetical protein